MPFLGFPEKSLSGRDHGGTAHTTQFLWAAAAHMAPFPRFSWRAATLLMLMRTKRISVNHIQTGPLTVSKVIFVCIKKWILIWAPKVPFLKWLKRPVIDIWGYQKRYFVYYILWIYFSKTVPSVFSVKKRYAGWKKVLHRRWRRWRLIWGMHTRWR